MTTTGDQHDEAVRLLLHLSRTTFSDDERLLAVEYSRSLTDWKFFTDLSVRHGVAALVWQNITDLSLTDMVPAPERDIFEGLRLKTIARVTYITSATAEIVSMLENEGIRALLLKGQALEHTVYGSRGLRQMSDADLLVSRQDILRARDILSRAGFVSGPLKSPLYRHIILDLGNHLPELHRGGMTVDLHHGLFGVRGAAIVSSGMKKPGIISAVGRDFYILPPETAFLCLVNHICKHERKGEFQLRLYTDIYLLVNKYAHDVFNKNLASDAEQAGILSEVKTVLAILSFAYGLKIPDELSATGDYAKEIAGIFMDNIRQPALVKGRSRRDIYIENLRSLKDVRRKMIFIAGDLFPSTEFMKRRYGCRTTLSALSRYPHRMGKLVWIMKFIILGR
jgi:hypothetical protein